LITAKHTAEEKKEPQSEQVHIVEETPERKEEQQTTEKKHNTKKHHKKHKHRHHGHKPTGFIKDKELV
jgi:hypothetical protein